MHHSPVHNLASLPDRMSGGPVKKLQVYESLGRPTYHPNQVERGGLGLHMNEPHRKDLRSGHLRSSLHRNGSFIVPFHILYGLPTAMTVFTCRGLSPRQIQSTTLINNHNSGRRDQSHQLCHSSPISEDPAPVRAQSPSGLVWNLTRALGQAMKDQGKMDLILPVVLR